MYYEEMTKKFDDDYLYRRFLFRNFKIEKFQHILMLHISIYIYFIFKLNRNKRQRQV
jgi:hypothetical protein